MSAKGRPEREHRSAQHAGGVRGAKGRPEREHRSAQHAGGVRSAKGRPEREHRSGEHERPSDANGRPERDHGTAEHAGPSRASWCREERSGAALALLLAVRAQPGARTSGVAGAHGDAIRIRLAAPAIEGKANAELQRFLADAFGVPLRRVTLLRGETGRRKLVRIDEPQRRPDREWG